MELVKPPAHAPVNVLLYGPPKMGKTTGATAPGAGTVLLANSDLPNASRNAHRQNPDLLEMRFPWRFEEDNPTAVMDALAELTHVAYGQEVAGEKIDRIVIDPLGELYRVLLEEQSLRTLRPSLPIRGDATTHLERFLRSLCVSPIDIVFVAHELQVDNGEEAPILLPLTGSQQGSKTGLGPKLAGMIDIIAYAGVMRQEDSDEPRYVAQVVPSEHRRGGDRFSCLSQGVGYRDLNVAEWINFIHEHDNLDSMESEPVSTLTQDQGEQDGAQ